ncbi:NACHT domain-containing protein [Erythrobacter sp. sf7]|uniref:NACHT domain-containing protein n=1 Tax=Erythrobacter fulvus TaxID=2987523 RepID=A0ABT5JS64_9SPHN|nr:NACHT domain-containing protein [Erythrobacter fulvus]MDC8755544.1 NACHT domain-containing protein [Erythrobacter fulvus]
MGLAGRGKSVLMRYLALSMYHAPRGKLPLFLELRSLNSLTKKDILHLIHAQYNSGNAVKFDDFLDALSRGYFVILLDGFDEIAPTDRDEVEREILEIRQEYPECPIVVSGRHDERFSSWESFTVLQLSAMTRDQTRLLIEKAEYSEEVKKNFLKRLTSAFFEEHESFLNTPLLAIMLMRTFEEYAEIPSSLHEFYRNAFDTLIRRHDAMKSQFLRATHSGCTAEEFKKVFASFCVLTYSKSAFSFHRDDALNYVSSAIRQQGMNADPSLLLKDLIESICLLHEEGLEISFVHRSFQEYFCAVFLSMSPGGFIERYFETANLRVHDNVLPMLMGICPERVEDEWASDFVEDLIKKYPKQDVSRHTRLFADRYPEWNLHQSSDHRFFSVFESTRLDRCVRILENLYPGNFQKWVRPKSVREVREKESRQIEALINLEGRGVTSLEGLSLFLKEASEKKEVPMFRFSVDPSFEPFFIELLGKNYETTLKGIDSIQKVQRDRRRKGDKFIEELFN